LNSRRRSPTARAAALAAALLGLGLLLAAGRAPGRAESADATPDCGVMALYNLLNVSGRSASLEDVLAASPASGGDGRSMLELKRTASRLGLELVGRLVEDRRTAPTSPWIAYIDDEQHGHYLVVRPVGHTGRLIQVLDGLAPPRVVDAADYFSRPGWTGLVLVPRG